MRAALSALLLVGGGLAAAAVAGGTPPPVGPVATTGGASTVISPTRATLSARLSTTRARARPITLTLRLRTNLVCGEPGPDPLVVQLPAGAPIAPSLGVEAVLVNAKHPAKVAVNQRKVTITPAPRKGIACDIMAPAVVKIRFGAGAKLGNPAAPGKYSISIRRGGAVASTTVRISA